MITIGQGQDQRISQFSLEQEWLESFISVPVEDLKKALDPTVWPLQVCVREFIGSGILIEMEPQEYQILIEMEPRV